MSERYKNICGVILAGGKGSRYDGKNKALLKIGSETFYNRTKRLLESVFENVIVITNKIEDFPNDYIPKYQDIIKNVGSLGGIHSALENAKGYEAVFIVAVDMPFLNETLIKEIIDAFKENKQDILIPVIDDNIEPLAAVYSLSVLENLRNYIETTSNYSVRGFFMEVDTKFYSLSATEINKKSFININSKIDYNKFI